MRLLVLYLFISALSYPSYSQQFERDSIGSKELSFSRIDVENIRQGGHQLFGKKKYKLALIEYEKALGLFQELTDSIGIAKCYNNIGLVQMFLNENQDAVVAFYKAIQLNKELNQNVVLVGNYINLASYYKRQSEYGLALQYYSEAKKLIITSDEKSKLALVYLGMGAILGDSEYSNHNFDSAYFYYSNAIASYNVSNDSINLSLVYNNLGVLASHQQKFDSAIMYYSKSLAYKEALDDITGRIISFLNLGNVYKEQGNYGLALSYYNQGSELAIEHDDKVNYLDLLTNIIKCKIKLGHLDEASTLFEEYTILSDSIKNKERAEQLKELEVLYETEKIGSDLKDQIKQTQAKTRQSYWFLAIAIGVVLLLIITVLFFVQRQRFQQKIREKELDRLTKEQEIKELNAMMQGQEEERNRIAEDLHDRLGARLSAIKLLALSSPQTNPKLTEMLEESIKETREISHNLSTDMLTRFGLENAIAEVVRSINGSSKIEGDFTTTNLDERLPRDIEKSLYYIVLELVNNTIKHSGASSFFIQLTRFENEIDLLYEDDGKGFDFDKVSFNGMGMKNLKARVESIKGKLNIDTSPGKGLHVMVNVVLA